MNLEEKTYERFAACKLCDSPIMPVNKEYALVQCKSCNLIFCEINYPPDEITRVYHNLYNDQNGYRSYHKESKALLKSQTPKLGRPRKWVLDRLIKSNCGSFLEIGAGVGVIGKYLTLHDYDYTGIELDSKAAEKAKQAGVHVLNGTFEIMQNIENQFDALIALEVIEHLQELKTFFYLSRNRLKINGLFGFTVPNFDKIKNYVDQSRIYQPAPPIHVNFFTLENLERILEMEHFEIVEIKVRSYPYVNLKKYDTYKFFLKALFRLYHGPTIMCIARKMN